ncbi:thioredoxin-like domain-containing protein [Mangrovihabitans endophyticus]|uniref:Thiol:disulfide interchange protein n=1 Tax=Mangrovihabitans endophyticus TaxID=1751298 RepID=A0A8J3C2P4_9ACTN|nr:thioredoxin-like domain-containing protein [Mangrovihabitans endophyticus]GGL00541.1 thiol:disulfide interchange protein [Mangrovihabitans endophyticus]
MNVRRLGLTVAALLLMPAAGCGAATDRGSADRGSAAGRVAASETLAFAGTTVDGAPFDARTMAGKPALLWFWAPWCATCAAQSGSVTAVHDEYRGRLGVLGIAGLGDNRAMREFISDMEVGSVTNLDDSAGSLWRRFRITEQSTYVLLDRTGHVVSTSYLDDQELRAELTRLLA